MKVSELIKSVNDLADDILPDAEVVNYLNDGIAKINTESGANFPFLDVITPDQEPVIPEKWQRLLLVPYATAKVKQKDSSQFEYSDLYAQFADNMSEFKSKYTVPISYKELVEQTITVNGSDYAVSEGEILQDIATANSTTVQAIIDENEEILFDSPSSVNPNFTGNYFLGGW